MLLAFGVVISGIFFFICCVNYYFQKEKYKHMTKKEIEKYSMFNRPGAWVSYAFAIAVVVIIIFSISFGNVYNGFSTISNDQEKINAANSSTNSSTSSSTFGN